MNETIELARHEWEQIPWSTELLHEVQDYDGFDENSSIRFYNGRADEMYVGEENSMHSDGYTSIGETGVSEAWDEFLQEIADADIQKCTCQDARPGELDRKQCIEGGAVECNVHDIELRPVDNERGWICNMCGEKEE